MERYATGKPRREGPARAHMAELDRKMAELASMKASLEQIVSSFPGDDRADCPILSKLDCAAPATLSNERRQRPMPAHARPEAPSYAGLAAWSRALNGGLAAQHA